MYFSVYFVLFLVVVGLELALTTGKESAGSRKRFLYRSSYNDHEDIILEADIVKFNHHEEFKLQAAPVFRGTNKNGCRYHERYRLGAAQNEIMVTNAFNCSIVTKVFNAQRAGFKALLIYGINTSESDIVELEASLRNVYHINVYLVGESIPVSKFQKADVSIQIFGDVKTLEWFVYDKRFVEPQRRKMSEWLYNFYQHKEYPKYDKYKRIRVNPKAIPKVFKPDVTVRFLVYLIGFIMALTLAGTMSSIPGFISSLLDNSHPPRPIRPIQPRSDLARRHRISQRPVESDQSHRDIPVERTHPRQRNQDQQHRFTLIDQSEAITSLDNPRSLERTRQPVSEDQRTQVSQGGPHQTHRGTLAQREQLLASIDHDVVLQEIIASMLMEREHIIQDFQDQQAEVTQAERIAAERIFAEFPCVTITEEQVDEILTCTVCICEFELDQHVKQLTCGHYFHIACIRQWFQMKTTCPNCVHNYSDAGAPMADY